MFSDYLRGNLGSPKDIGHELRFNCPFCGPNNDFKLYVKVATDSSDGLWQCKKCGAHGRPVKFVMKYESVSFKGALDSLEMYDYELDQTYETARDLGITPEEYLIVLLSKVGKVPLEEEEEEKLVAPPLIPGYKRLMDNVDNPEAWPFFGYCMQRGFTEYDIVTHNIGYVRHAEVPSQSGGTFNIYDHLVFLTHDDDGHYQYWNTRSIKPTAIKSINGVSGDGEYSRRTSIFNLNIARHQEAVVICEGVPDALTIGPSGVGTFGKQVTRPQVDQLVDKIPQETPIYIFLDNDAIEEIAKVARDLYPRHKKTYLVINPGGEDPNDMGQEKAWDVILNNSVIADEMGILKLQIALKNN